MSLLWVKYTFQLDILQKCDYSYVFLEKYIFII